MATRKTSSPAKKAQPVEAKSSTASYQHPDAQALIRPEAGAQTRFKKKKPAATWRYDSSLAPELQWDALNPAREQGETHIAALQAALANVQSTLTELLAQLAGAQPSQPAADLHRLLHEAQARLAKLQTEPLRAGREAAAALKALSRPFLNWAGKAEHVSFDVPTLPLFIHERLSTQAILNSIASHKTVQQGDWINMSKAFAQIGARGLFAHRVQIMFPQQSFEFQYPWCRGRPCPDPLRLARQRGGSGLDLDGNALDLQLAALRARRAIVAISHAGSPVVVRAWGSAGRRDPKLILPQPTSG